MGLPWTLVCLVDVRDLLSGPLTVVAMERWDSGSHRSAQACVQPWLPALPPSLATGSLAALHPVCHTLWGAAHQLLPRPTAPLQTVPLIQAAFSQCRNWWWN